MLLLPPPRGRPLSRTGISPGHGIHAAARGRDYRSGGSSSCSRFSSSSMMSSSSSRSTASSSMIRSSSSRVSRSSYRLPPLPHRRYPGHRPPTCLAYGAPTSWIPRLGALGRGTPTSMSCASPPCVDRHSAGSSGETHLQQHHSGLPSGQTPRMMHAAAFGLSRIGGRALLLRPAQRQSSGRRAGAENQIPPRMRFG